ncbi:helix-turn-helix transcriptional regulator [Hydrogenophaga electricum]|uniref:DNA-binding transcriptional regulator n=1 Tax=Hydrogenophaga electricum TaxID=1230953 RepID=A0ABQ6BXT8_9BURK|nr:WYL domain-containing protein [Hydrogenophaga electricum]GLS12752.1 DNA-binding transcriptional regulator [Hydrogenophaga electricum]
MSKTERLHQLSKTLRQRRRVTLAELMQTLQVSRATLMRDLDWLRVELGHPIHWDHEARCYVWRESELAGEQPEEMAGLWLRPSEVLALVTLDQLLRDIQPGDLLRGHLQPLENRLTKMLKQSGLDRSAQSLLGRRVRVIGLWQRRVPPQCFETVGLALTQRLRLRIHYQARGSGQSSERSVSPQRLIHYRSNWLLDAWCHERDELRSFSLDNISQPQIEDTPAIDLPEDELDQTLGNGYGIFSGKEVQWATLRFSPERARWVAAEQWHPAQKGEWDSEGHWLLQIPYIDDRELVMDILRHTPEVEVLAPAALRERVLQRMRDGVARWGVS